MVKFRETDRPIEPIGYTLEEIAEALRIHPETARKMLTSGELPGRKIGREWRISPQAVESWLAVGDTYMPPKPPGWTTHLKKPLGSPDEVEDE